MLYLKNMKTLIKNDLDNIIELIKDNINSNVFLIQHINEYIINIKNNKAKYLRPLLLILVTRALNYKKHLHIKVGAIIELIHTATLLHDDVIDQSELRRGKKTAHSIFGNSASILTGDFLYSRAFQIMVSLNNIPIIKIVSDATTAIAEGEVLQLFNSKKLDITVEEYMKIIYLKTAKLFEAICDISSIIANANSVEKKSLHLYGKHLGNAFQIIDDCLDYTSKINKIGKTINKDLKEGKITLPLILTLKSINDKDTKIIHNAINDIKNIKNINIINNFVKKASGIKKSFQYAKNESLQAIESLKNIKDSSYKEALITIANLILKRKF